MIALLRTRLLAAERLQHKDKPFNFSFGADTSDLADFLRQATDDHRIGDLVQGLALLKDIPRGLSGQKNQYQYTVLPGAYAVLKPFFTTDTVLEKIGFLPPNCKLPFRAEILAWLTVDQPDKAVKLGWDKLRQVGVALPAFPNQPPSALGINGPRLLAALPIPIEFG
jgi:CRISPR-associated protein Csx17